MLVRSLRLRDFRNLPAVEIEPGLRFNVIVGQNGQGKTNLLESVYLLAALKSFRSLRNAALIRHGAPNALCSAWIDRGGMRREVELTLRPRGRKVSLNGNTVRKLSDFFGLVNAVSFCPEDVTVLRDSPGSRRTFLDRMIFNALPGYATEMSDYEAALKHRNALIKDGIVRDQSLLSVYDQQVVMHGTEVMARRRDFIAEMREPLIQSFGEIFGEGFDPDIAYRSKFLGDHPEHDEILNDDARLAAEFQTALDNARRKDLARGFTTIGPHRDDFIAHLLGNPMRDFASQGQHRAFVLALKITEIRMLRETLGHYPILLLDDVSSELDPQRNEKLFDFLSTIEGQVFITTTDVNYVRLHHEFRRFDVSNGQVTPA